MYRTCLVLGGILCAGAVASSAHETWLAPKSFRVAPGKEAVFDLTSGMEFPKLDYAIGTARVVEAQARVADKAIALKMGKRTENALHLTASFPDEGVAVAWIKLGPKTLDLTDAKVAEYFAEIDPPREVRERWAENKGRIPWTETYTKCAKAYFRVGDQPADDSWKRPVGLPLEIVPLSDPTSWKSEEKVSCLLLENGKPLPQITVGLLTEGGSQRRFATTGADGKVEVALENAGDALLFAVHLHWVDGRWESNFTTLSVHVGP